MGHGNEDGHQMRLTRSLLPIGLIIGSIVIISIIILIHFSGTATLYCSYPEDPQFYLYNNDMNSSHVVKISVYNASHQIETEGSFELPGGDQSATGGIRTTIHPLAHGEMNYSVTFIVDGNTSSHFEKIAGSANCSEAFYLDSKRGVIRPYDIACPDRPCQIQPRKMAGNSSGYPDDLVIDSFGVTTLRPQDIGVNTLEELDARL
jgi:hypothetical protein